LRLQGSGIRVQGSGFRVQGPGSRVQGHRGDAPLGAHASAFSDGHLLANVIVLVTGSRFTVHGIGIRVWGLGIRVWA